MASSIFWAIWRRIYGEGKAKKYISRTIQTIIGVVVLSLQLNVNFSLEPVLISLAVAVWIVIQYWSRAVGEIIDAGLNPCQGRKDYDRWFRPVCNFIVRCLNYILPDKYHIKKYQGVYDWIYSAMRNLVGVLPALFLYPSWLWWILVFCMYPIYLFCFKLFYCFPDLWNNKLMQKLTLNEPKNLAEVIHGGIFGLVVGMI